MARFSPPGSGFFQSLMGGPRRVEWPLGIYGKLPFYKDFLRANATGQEASTFRAWLDRGFSRFWEADPASRDADIPPHGFVLYLPDLDGIVLGRLRGSHDSGGLRRFPLVLFATHPAGRGAGRSLTILHALRQILPHLREADQILSGAESVETFYTRARDLSLAATLSEHDDVLQQLRNEIEGCTIADFARGMFGEDAERMWPGLLDFCRRQQVQGRLGIRIPLTGDLDAMVQALVWAAVLVGGEPRKQPPVSLIIPLTEPDAGIVLIQRQLRPDDTLLFNPTCQGYEFVEDLRRGIPGANTPSPLPDRPLSTLI